MKRVTLKRVRERVATAKARVLELIALRSGKRGYEEEESVLIGYSLALDDMERVLEGRKPIKARGGVAAMLNEVWEDK